MGERMNKDLKILMTSSDSTGCGLLRTQLPALELKKTYPWTEYRLGFPPRDPVLQEADIIFLQRATNEFFFDWIPKAQAEGKKIVFDIDDSLWDIPAANLAHRYYPTKELKKLEKVMKMCDLITVSTEPLRDRIISILGRTDVHVIKNLLPYESYEKPKNEKPRIIWAGSYTHNGDFDKHLVKALREVVKEYDVEFYTFGFTPQFFKDFAISVPWVDTQEYMSKLKELNGDIGIIVAEDNQFNRSKSNLKFLEYGLTKIAPIAHNTYPYATTMTHGQDSFLVQNPKTDWKSYLVELIKNEELRVKIQHNAHQTVKDNFTFDSQGEWFLKQYQEIFKILGF